MREVALLLTHTLLVNSKSVMVKKAGEIDPEMQDLYFGGTDLEGDDIPD
jgi:hypothetical protein